MSVLIDNAAKKLYEDDGYSDWAGLGSAFKEAYRRRVRSVLASIRQPTEAMVDAGIHTDHDGTLGGRASSTYTAMIDAARSEG